MPTCSGSEVQRLLKLRSAFSNWDMYERTEGLNWTLHNPMCGGWGGVQCSAGFVTGLNFSGPDPTAPQRPPVLQGVASAAVHGSEPLALQGALLCTPLCASAVPRRAALGKPFVGITAASISDSMSTAVCCSHTPLWWARSMQIASAGLAVLEG